MRIVIVTIALLLIRQFSFSQITLTGPACVVSNLEYYYRLSGNWDSSSYIKVCVTGGRLTGETPDCSKTAPTSLLRIIWDSNSNDRTISVNSSGGDALLNVVLALPLEGGIINDGSTLQTIDSSALPTDLICSAAKGGGCTPTYSYQWQKSSDNQNWTDISGELSPNFHFSDSLRQTIYYRRKTAESASATIAYSNTILIVLRSSETQH